MFRSPVCSSAFLLFRYNSNSPCALRPPHPPRSSAPEGPGRFFPTRPVTSAAGRYRSSLLLARPRLAGGHSPSQQLQVRERAEQGSRAMGTVAEADCEVLQ
jgi:hypothetical protein